MSVNPSSLEVLKQRITELEAENVKIRGDYETEITELKEENAKISELKKENTDLRNKLSVYDAEIAELKRRNVETLRVIMRGVMPRILNSNLKSGSLKPDLQYWNRVPR